MGGSKRGVGVLVTLQHPSRHTLHVKHNCTETPRESTTEMGGKENKSKRERERERGRERG